MTPQIGRYRRSLTETQPQTSRLTLVLLGVLSPGPLEVTSLSLEYGPQVLTEVPTRGLVLSETEQHFQVSVCRIRRDANPLISSVFYDREYLDEAGITVSVREGSVVHRP